MLGNTGFRKLMWWFVFYSNSCRCDAMETEKSNGGDFGVSFVCLDGVWDIWLYSAITSLKCVLAPIHHSISMVKISSNFKQVNCLVKICRVVVNILMLRHNLFNLRFNFAIDLIQTSSTSTSFLSLRRNRQRSSNYRSWSHKYRSVCIWGYRLRKGYKDVS